MAGEKKIRLTDAQHNLILGQLEDLAARGEYWGNRQQFEKRLGELIALRKTGDLYWEARKASEPQIAGLSDPTCPGPDCPMCSGEACNKCGAGCSNTDPDRPPCEHDSLQRHEPYAPAPTRGQRSSLLSTAAERGEDDEDSVP